MQELSREEQAELSEIRQNLSLDPKRKIWTTKYPYKHDPNVLQNNKEQVITMTERTEKRLLPVSDYPPGPAHIIH